MRRSRLIGTLTLAIAALIWHSQADAGSTSADQVKATVTATKPGADGKQTVTITLVVEKEWYIYANPVGLDDIKSNRTLVVVKADKPVQATIDYPPGKAKVEGLSKYYIYQPTVTIPIQLRRTIGDTSPLQISIDVNACHPGKGPDGDGAICLPRGVIKLIVP